MADETSKPANAASSKPVAATNTPVTSGVRKLTSKPLNYDQESYSTSINDMLYSLFDHAIQELYSDLPDASVVITQSKVADYQCNSAMAISQVITALI